MKWILIISIVLLAPVGVFAATASVAQNLIFNNTVPQGKNVYLAGGSVTIATTSPSDLTVIGGTVVTSAPVSGDALLAGGSVSLQGRIGTNARIVGGRVVINAPVHGDLAVLAVSVTDYAANAKRVLIIGGNVRLESGARGSVAVYGNNVYLDGVFNGNVRVSSLNTLTLAPDTIIKGTLRYQASEAALIPSSAHINGGVMYTGASFLPTSQEAEAFMLAGIGIFFLVRILGALIVAGLFAGLFPMFSNHIMVDIFDRPVRHSALLVLLGFGIIVATPVLIFLLALTFVGLGVAVVLGASYLLLVLISFVYTGIIAGAAISRALMKRQYVTWRDAVFGMLVVMLVWAIPLIGNLVFILLSCLAAGALISTGYSSIFGRQSIHLND